MTTRGVLWAMVGVAAIAVALALRAIGLSLDMASSSVKILFFLGIIALAALSGRLSDARLGRIACFLEHFGLLSLVSLLGGLASYTVAAGTTGYVDAILAAADRSLGFDWTQQYAFLAAHPSLAHVAAFFYGSIIFSPAIILAGLVWSGRAARATDFVLAFGIALATTIGFFRFFPARSALAHHVGAHPGFMPTVGMRHIDVIDSLRAGTLTRIDPDAMAGIVTFPSFHAAAALLFMWAAWPVRWLRGPMLAINLAMLAATPVEGTHYLVDILAGLAVAAAAIASLRLPQLARGMLRPRAAMRVTATA